MTVGERSIWDVIVVGAGPAGLLAARFAAEAGTRVLVLEKNSLPGNKLLLTGGGRCNITHAGGVREILDECNQPIWLKHSLHSFGSEDLVSFFRDIGVEIIFESDGKGYPSSYSSRDVLEALKECCVEKKVCIQCDSGVKYIEWNNGVFELGTSKQRFWSRNLVIASGGRSLPTTGSSGDGHVFARSLGHGVVEPMPALVPLYMDPHPLGVLSGLSFPDMLVSVFRFGKKVISASGAVLITHKGLSGPNILDISRHVKCEDTITLNLSGAPDKQCLKEDLLSSLSGRGSHLLRTVLQSLGLPETLASLLLKLRRIPLDTRCAQTRKEWRLQLVDDLFGFSMKVGSRGTFSESMVTHGGVDVSEVNPLTMESRIIEGLYFAGEVLDIDGSTGGYNLQLAFSTAWVAGQNISSKILH